MRYLLPLVIALSSCKWQSEDSSVAQVKNTAIQDIGKAVSDISGEHVCSQKITVENMQVDFIGAGIQTTRLGNFVRLYFNAHECRDYLEIMRCNEAKRHALTCRDGDTLAAIGDIEDTQRMLDNPYGTTVNRDGLRDCWNSVAGRSDSGCVLLGGYKDSHGDVTGRVYGADYYIDASAPAGQKFFYLARSCVHVNADGTRANELTSGNQTCSQQLAISNVVISLEHYTLHNEVLEARTRVASIAARLNYMTDEAYRITMALSEALAVHEEKEIERQRGMRLRQGIAMISGMAIGVVGSVYAGGADWIGDGLDAGQALGAAFADIAASEDDYPKSCYDCMRLRGELIAVIGDIQGTNADTTGMDVTVGAFGGDDIQAKAAGLKYFQALKDYEEAIAELQAKQEEHRDFETDQKLSLGSQGGPTW